MGGAANDCHPPAMTGSRGLSVSVNTWLRSDSWRYPTSEDMKRAESEELDDEEMIGMNCEPVGGRLS